MTPFTSSLAPSHSRPFLSAPGADLSRAPRRSVGISGKSGMKAKCYFFMNGRKINAVPSMSLMAFSAMLLLMYSIRDFFSTLLTSPPFWSLAFAPPPAPLWHSAHSVAPAMEPSSVASAHLAQAQSKPQLFFRRILRLAEPISAGR